MILAALILAGRGQASARSLREYARSAVMHRYHDRAQWEAFDAIVRPESSWDPCSHYPSSHDCGYAGSNSCGLAQRNPCPRKFAGRLWQTRFRQVWDAIHYMSSRYGSPLGALSFRRAHGWY